MTEQPAIKAGMSLGMSRHWGTFHGTIAATTPIGALRRWTSPSQPWRRSCQGNARPTSSANCIIDSGPVAWPSLEKLVGEPISAVMRSAISSTWPPYTAASFSTFSIRSRGDIFGQGPWSNARRAAATALSTSAAEALGASAMGCSVYGDITEMRSAVDGVSHRPPMKSLSYDGILNALPFTRPDAGTTRTPASTPPKIPCCGL